jgi:hypothetical protein
MIHEGQLVYTAGYVLTPVLDHWKRWTVVAETVYIGHQSLHRLLRILREARKESGVK